MNKGMGSTEPDLLRDSEMFFLTCELRKVFLGLVLCENLQREMEVGLREVSQAKQRNSYDNPKTCSSFRFHIFWGCPDKVHIFYHN